MKNFLIAVMFLMSVNGFTQIDTSMNLIGEVSSYINLEKSKGKERHNQCRVYILDVYKEDSLQRGYATSLGYIMNSSEYKYVKTKYYFKIGEDVVLVQLDKYTNEEYLKGVDLQKVTIVNEYKLVQKLFPNDLVTISYQASGLITNFNERGVKINSTFYERDDQMPFKRSKYRKFPQGGKIELIEE